MSKRQQQKIERSQAIIKAATELFLQQGVQNVQLQDVANAAEIGIATLFRYFPKKEYLIIAVTNAITLQMAENVRQIVEQPASAYARMEQILTYYMQAAEDPNLRLAKFFESFDLYEKLAEEAPEEYTEYRKNRSLLANTLLQLVADGKEDGSIRTDIELELFVLTMVQNFSFYTFKSSLATHDPSLATLLSAPKQLAMMKDIFLDYVRIR